MADGESRTEPATQRKREDARRKGQTSQSTDLTIGLSLLAGMLTLYLAGGTIGAQMARLVRGSLAALPYGELATRTSIEIARGVLLNVWSVAAIVVTVVLTISIATAMLQSGWNFTFQPLTPDWERLSPARGWQRIFSRRSVLRGVFTILRATAMTAVVLLMLQRDQHLLAGAAGGSLAQAIFHWLADYHARWHRSWRVTDAAGNC